MKHPTFIWLMTNEVPDWKTFLFKVLTKELEKKTYRKLSPELTDTYAFLL